MVRRRLGGGIGRTRIVTRLFDERALVSQRSVNLVGRHVQKAECVPPLGRQRLPIGSRRLEHREGADDVGLDERVAGRDRPIDVALGGEMDDLIGSECLERLGDRASVANVNLGEAIVRRIVDHGQGLQIAGIGERVEVEHCGAVGHQTPAHSRADESRAAGHKHFALHESCL